ELAAALGRRLEVLEVDWESIITTLRDGHVDMIMGGMTITPARQVQVAFSDPYLRSGLLALMRREDASRFKKVAHATRPTHQVGAISGRTAERFVREPAPDAQPTVYRTVTAAINELHQRRVSLLIHDAPVAIWFAGGDEANLAVLLQLLDQEDLGWAMARDNDALRTAVNQVLARWRTDGTRDRILSRWVPYWQRLETTPAAR